MKLDPKISLNQDQRTSRNLPQCTSVLGLPPHAATVPAGIHSCCQKTSGPTSVARPVAPPVGCTDPPPWERLVCALPRPASRSPPVLPAAACRPLSSVLPEWLSSAP